MKLLKVLLVFFAVAIAVYTLAVFFRDGVNFVPPFVSAIASVTWQGQFNLDFSFYIILSALWLMWRHEFSPVGYGLAALSIFGMAFFAPYLLIQCVRARGDVQRLLLGGQAAR